MTLRDTPDDSHLQTSYSQDQGALTRNNVDANSWIQTCELKARLDKMFFPLAT
jgi:hypothetical protein